MRKLFFPFYLVLFSSFSFAQQNQATQGDVYAIVVGVSSYRYIKPLNYADRDADLFAELLRSGAGGRIKSENLFLLKNDSANAGNFWSALLRISNKKLKKGDRVYIYFAGHGDAVKGLNEYYLLLSDCQPANDGNNYLLSFGAIDMYHLKNRIGLLTAQGAEVVLILDACRTNELAGGYASQVFNSSIIQTKVGEIVMLATGPGQVSIEDASFGRGHGLFTYNLIDALSGRADKEEAGNNDSTISLDETKKWVSKHVQLMSENFHVLQSPVFCCEENNNAMIGFVDSSFMVAWDQLKQLNNNLSPSTASTIRRSNDLTVDSSLLVLYNKFNITRKENKLWGDSSANSYFDQMANLFPDDPLTENARYALSSDFINFVQEKINLYLEGKDVLSVAIMQEKNDSLEPHDFLTDEYDRIKKTLSEKWTIAGLMLQKAGKLLSPGDSSILLQLKPKINFLFARGFLNGEEENKLNYEEVLQYAIDAYKADSSAAYTAECLALLYAYKHSFDFDRHTYKKREDFYVGGKVRSDTAFYYFRKATLLAPNWVSPYRSIGLKVYGIVSIDTAIIYMKKAISTNPKDVSTYIMMGDLIRIRKPDSAVYYYKLAVTMSPKFAQSDLYRKIGRSFFHFRKGTQLYPIKFDSVIWYSRKALSLDPNNVEAYANIAGVYDLAKNADSVLHYRLKIITLSKGKEHPYLTAIRVYNLYNKKDSVFRYCKKILEIDPQNQFVFFELGRYYDYTNHKTDSAIYYYKKSLGLNYSSIYIWERLGYLIMSQDKNDPLPLTYFTQLLNASPDSWRPYYHIACYYSNYGETDKAIDFLQKALEKGLRNKKQIDSEPFLAFIRNTEPFKKLMEKYFPYFK